MDWYYYIAWAAIISQVLFLFYVCRNYRYALREYKKKREWYQPKTVLIIPCKGLDAEFHENIASFFNQDYDNFVIYFVVADGSDPADAELHKLKDQLSEGSKARDIRILAAGQAQCCSQKIHNLLYCYERVGKDVDILAFADSDICVRSDWLRHLVYPLRQAKNGVASGYRWFVPKQNNPASLALSAINAKVAQLLGNTRFNQAWGGSMAIRAEDFRRLGLDKIWPNVLSDDLSLSRAVKKAGMKVAFVPACLAASHTATTWRGLLEFGRRQFLITRVNAPGTWWFGLLSSLYSILGLWGGAGLAIYTANTAHEHLSLFAAVPAAFFITQLGQAILRQRMISKLLREYLQQMRPAVAADILGFWLWSLLLLLLIISSTFGRTIRWRGVRYKLLGPMKTVIVGDQS